MADQSGTRLTYWCCPEDDARIVISLHQDVTFFADLLGVPFDVDWIPAVTLAEAEHVVEQHEREAHGIEEAA
jgi:hypothetical protein